MSNVTDFSTANAATVEDMHSRFSVFQDMYSSGCEAYNDHHEWIYGQMGSAILAAVTLDSPTPNILDIGTGTGLTARSLATAIPHARIFSADFNKDMLGVAQRNDTPRPFLADYQNLPFQDEVIDMVAAVLTLTNGCDVERTLCEVSRVLRSTGALAIVESCADPLGDDIIDAFNRSPYFSGKHIEEVVFERVKGQDMVHFPLYMLTANKP